MSRDAQRLRRASDGTVVCGRVVMGTSFWQRFRGLMGRAELADDEGLYLPTSSIHMFFMRFPIDALFVSKADPAGRRRVVGLRPHLPPWRGLVLPVRGAEAVVEMAAGSLSRAGVGLEDEVMLEPVAEAAAPPDATSERKAEDNPG